MCSRLAFKCATARDETERVRQRRRLSLSVRAPVHRLIPILTMDGKKEEGTDLSEGFELWAFFDVRKMIYASPFLSAAALWCHFASVLLRPARMGSIIS